MKKSTRFLSAVICIALLLSCLPCTASAESSGARMLTFRYEQYESSCYYSDAYFTNSAYVYDPSLSSMSLAFAVSAFGATDQTKTGAAAYADGAKNAKQLLLGMGFAEDAIETNEWYQKKPTTDSIAVIAGQKKIRIEDAEYTLIALAVRGGGYEQEWASNFTLGKSGEHKGFAQARDMTLAFLRQFIENQQITGSVKLWLTGYSRGGAVANLTAGALDRALQGSGALADGVSCLPEDLYAYCFEPPAGAVAAKVNGVPLFRNIFNIVNSDDFVTLVAPKVYGFGRYGVDHVLPSQKSDESYASRRDAMVSLYCALPGFKSYDIDAFRMKKLLQFRELELILLGDNENDHSSQGLFFDHFIVSLAKDAFESRAVYASSYEQLLRDILSVVFNCSDAANAQMLQAIADCLVSRSDLLLNMRSGSTDQQALESALAQALKDAYFASEHKQLDDAQAQLAARSLVLMLIRLFVSDPDGLSTLICNVGGIAAAHQPMLCMAWLKAMDPNFGAILPLCFNNGSYRLVTTDAETEITVYNAAQQPVARAEDCVPQYVAGSTLISRQNDDGAVQFVLPVDRSYSVVMPAQDDEDVTYRVEEYCALTGTVARTVRYEADVESGDTLTGEIPAFSAEEIDSCAPKGSSVRYTLRTRYGELPEISPILWPVIGRTNVPRQLPAEALLPVVQREPYTDVSKSDSFYDAIVWCRKYGLLEGTSEQTFSPEKAVTRGMVMTVLARMSGVDTSGKVWYERGAQWCKNNGISDGSSPMAEITREQFAAMLFRYAKFCGESTAEQARLDHFPDADKVSAYAVEPMQWATAQGILGGIDGKLVPQNALNRAQFAEMLMRFWQ